MVTVVDGVPVAGGAAVVCTAVLAGDEAFGTTSSDAAEHAVPMIARANAAARWRYMEAFPDRLSVSCISLRERLPQRLGMHSVFVSLAELYLQGA